MRSAPILSGRAVRGYPRMLSSAADARHPSSPRVGLVEVGLVEKVRVPKLRASSMAMLAGVALVLMTAMPFGAGAQSVSATPEQLAVLDEILARSEFQSGEGRGFLDAILDPVRTALSAVVREALRWISRVLGAGGAATGYASLAAAFAIVLGAGLVVVRLARGTLAAEAQLAREAQAGPPRAEAELARAEALARAGDLRGAVHHRYLAVLRRLDERGLLLFDRALTNREHLLRAGASPAVAESLAPLVGAFDQLWYGQSSCSRDEYAQFADLADRVWQASGARGQGSGARGQGREESGV